MAWTSDVAVPLAKLEDLRNRLKRRFVDRERVIDTLALAAIAHEHVLLIGEPGTAKSQIVGLFADMIDAKKFDYLLTRFTEPSELFGPFDFEKFAKGVYHIETKNMLPDAEVVFLDEIFNASSAVLNTLLRIVNEREFNNGSEVQKVDLVSMVGASNDLPDDEMLRAFSDRFLLRLTVKAVEGHKLNRLLEAGMAYDRERIAAVASGAGEADQGPVSLMTTAELRRLHGALNDVAFPADIQSVYARIIASLRSADVDLSDRRAVHATRLVKAAALLRSSEAATLEDFWPLFHIWSRAEEEERVLKVMNQELPEISPDQSAIESLRVEDLEDELEACQAQIAAQEGGDDDVSDATLLRLLEELGQLRRRARRHFPDADALRGRIDRAIASAIEKMSAAA